ncbi:MAG: ferritin [Myxococcota bacterium]
MAGQYHEPRDVLSTKTLDVKRAIDSMMEELEAIDWYRQRAEAASDPALRAILDHHQREEIEHFAMLLEWLRRNDADFADQLRDYLFTEGDIVAAEEEANGPGDRGSGSAGEAPAERESRRRTIGGLKEGT